MSLIDECKKLRELEQKYKITPYDGNLEVYSLHLQEHGSAMLEVLGMIREGDANSLESAINVMKIFPCDVGLESEYRIMVLEALDRMKQMAALMETER